MLGLHFDPNSFRSFSLVKMKKEFANLFSYKILVDSDFEDIGFDVVFLWCYLLFLCK